MPERFRRILPYIISQEGGSLTSYSDYASVYAVKSTVTENPHLFSIDYNLPYYGEGSCQGMILDQRITLFDFLPIPLFDTSFSATTSLTNTGISIDIDTDNIPTFTKTSGNSAGTTNVFIIGSTAFDFGQLVECEIYHEDTSSSGDRLFGIGISIDGTSPISGSSGNTLMSTIYRFSNFWNVYQASLTGGSYAGYGITGLNSGASNDKYNPGKTVRLGVQMDSPYSAGSTSRISYFEEGEANVFSGGLPASSTLSPSNEKTVNLGIYMYSYPDQNSRTKLLRIRIRDLPQYTSQPTYPTYP